MSPRSVERSRRFWQSALRRMKDRCEQGPHGGLAWVAFERLFERGLRNLKELCESDEPPR